MAIDIAFAKMNGLGNQIIVADMRGRGERFTADAVRALHHDPATSFDQIMAIHDGRAPGVDGFVRIYNNDGSEAGACGNGMRCVVRMMAAGSGRTNFVFETTAGPLSATDDGQGLISVDMGQPRFAWRDIPLAKAFDDTTGIALQIGPIDKQVLHTPSVVNMGNPHAVFWVEGDVWSHDLERLGPLLENHPIFPDRANITVAHVAGAGHIIIRTWERGVGLTQACGSAACAALVCGARKKLTDRAATVTVPGGDLHIDWRDDGHVIMTGPAQWEFSGLLDPVTGLWQRQIAGDNDNQTQGVA